MTDFLIQEVAAKIANREREIIDDFCKTFIAYQSLEGVPISEIFKKYRLCHMRKWDGYNMVQKYWFEEIDEIS